jgi:hypothetical protein
VLHSLPLFSVSSFLLILLQFFPQSKSSITWFLLYLYKFNFLPNKQQIQLHHNKLRTKYLKERREKQRKLNRTKNVDLRAKFITTSTSIIGPICHLADPLTGVFSNSPFIFLSTFSFLICCIIRVCLAFYLCFIFN